MQIQSTRAGAIVMPGPAVRTAGPKQAAQEGEQLPSDGVSLSAKPPHDLKPWIGGALGGVATGLALSACGAGIWSAVGAVAGAAAGALIGHRWDPLTYDARSVVHYLNRRSQSERLNKEYDENRDALTPLESSDRIAVNRAGNVDRLFDGYDSSRDVTALMSSEGAPADPYRLGLEFRNLRPEAQKAGLFTHFDLKAGAKTFSLDVLGDNQVALGGRLLTPEQAKSKFSVRYNQLTLEVDKKLLRDSAWKDGQPLEVQARTSAGQGKAEFDSIGGFTNKSARESLFRWEGKTVYQILTDRFSNGDKTNDTDADSTNPTRYHGGDWQGVIDKLDYLNDMGVDCIWLSCPYKNDRDFFGQDGYHGYWPHDFNQVEPEFGDKAKLKELVDRAHQKGMKVLLDVVINHTGYDNPLAKDEAHKDWFHHEGARNPFSQYYLEHGSLAGLPDLAQENPKVARYLIDVHKKWEQETGVDGFRVDAVRHVPGQFLRNFDTELKADHDGFLTVGEVFWNDPHYLAGYQNETQDTLFDFPLMEALRDVFGGNPDQTLMQRWEQFQEVKQHNFGQAIMDLTKQGGSSMQKLSKVLKRDHAYDNPRLLSTILDNHDTGRFLSHAGGDKSKLEIALGFLYACRGTPSLYYGTETGMEGQLGENRADMDFKGSPELHDFVQKLIHLRKDSKPLQLGTQTELMVDDTAYAFSRVLPGQEVVCVFNNSEEPRTLEIPLTDTQLKDGDRLDSLLEKGKTLTVEDGKVKVELPARGFSYLEWSGGPS